MNSQALIRPTDIARSLGRSWRKAPAMARMVGTMGLRSRGSRLSLGRVIEHTAQRYPDSPAVKSDVATLTWRAFDRRSNQLASALREAGVRPGQTVALMMDNRQEYLLIGAAVAKLGAVTSLVNTT